MRIQQKPLTRHALGAFITAGSTLLGAWMVTLAFKAIAQARSEEPIDWGRHSGALADTFEQSLGQTILTRLDNTVGLLLLVLLVAVILSGLYQLGFLWLYRNKVGVYHSLGLFWMDFWLSPSVPFVSIFLLLLLGVQLDVIPVGFLTSYGVWVLVLALVDEEPEVDQRPGDKKRAEKGAADQPEDEAQGRAFAPGYSPEEAVGSQGGQPGHRQVDEDEEPSGSPDLVEAGTQAVEPAVERGPVAERQEQPARPKQGEEEGGPVAA